MKKLLLIVLLLPSILFCMKHPRDETTGEIKYIDPKLLRPNNPSEAGSAEEYKEFTGYEHLMPNPESEYQAPPLTPLYLEVPNSTTSHVCATCGKAFKKKGNLNRHIKTVHEKQKPFKCEHCGRTFGQKEHLNKHIKVVHPQVNLLDNSAEPANELSVQ